MISVLILTFNEELNIGECIRSIPPSFREDVQVLDSFSSDDTVSVAQENGAKVLQRSFRNYADQRNFGLSLEFDFPWILMIDADERMTSELVDEISMSIQDEDIPFDIFRVRRKDFFMGRWLRRSSGYPTYFPRLFRRGAVRVERAINEEYLCNGEVKDLKQHLLHFPFNKGMTWWYQRHAKYASMEAEVLNRERSHRSIAFGNLFSADAAKRRASLKQIAYRLPARPVIVFLYLFVLRLGFLDGVAGYQYARMRSAYENMIDAISLAQRHGEKP